MFISKSALQDVLVSFVVKVTVASVELEYDISKEQVMSFPELDFSFLIRLLTRRLASTSNSSCIKLDGEFSVIILPFLFLILLVTLVAGFLYVKVFPAVVFTFLDHIEITWVVDTPTLDQL